MFATQEEIAVFVVDAGAVGEGDDDPLVTVRARPGLWLPRGAVWP